MRSKGLHTFLEMLTTPEVREQSDPINTTHPAGIYKKNTDTNTFLHYMSHHCKYMKLTLVKILIHKAYNLAFNKSHSLIEFHKIHAF